MCNEGAIAHPVHLRSQTYKPDKTENKTLKCSPLEPVMTWAAGECLVCRPQWGSASLTSFPSGHAQPFTCGFWVFFSAPLQFSPCSLSPGSPKSSPGVPSVFSRVSLPLVLPPHTSRISFLKDKWDRFAHHRSV